MDILLEIRTRLADTLAIIREMERDLLDYPDDPSISANLDSMVRMRIKLERQFNEATVGSAVEVNSHRSFDGLSPPEIQGEAHQHHEEQPL